MDLGQEEKPRGSVGSSSLFVLVGQEVRETVGQASPLEAFTRDRGKGEDEMFVYRIFVLV